MAQTQPKEGLRNAPRFGVGVGVSACSTVRYYTAPGRLQTAILNSGRWEPDAAICSERILYILQGREAVEGPSHGGGGNHCPKVGTPFLWIAATV